MKCASNDGVQHFDVDNVTASAPVPRVMILSRRNEVPGLHFGLHFALSQIQFFGMVRTQH